MVAAAAASKILGPIIRSKGSKMMRSGVTAGVRSLGSSMMRTTDEKIGTNIDKIAKSSQLAIKGIGKISKFTAKILNTLGKHSPALKQQLVVLGKGFSLLLRPIGDTMARWVRPMAIWVLKWARNRYEKKTVDSESLEGSYDKLQELEEQKSILEAFGEDTSTVDAKIEAQAAKTLQLFAEKVTGQTPGQVQRLTQTYEDLAEFSSDFTTLAGEYTTIYGKGIKAIDEFVDSVNKENESLCTEADNLSAGMSNGLTSMEEDFMTFSTGAGEATDNLATGVSRGLSSLENDFMNFSTATSNVIDDLNTGMSNGLISMQDLFMNYGTGSSSSSSSSGGSSGGGSSGGQNNIPVTYPDDIDTGESNGGSSMYDQFLGNFATGGSINETGMYRLHAGETVLNAGDTSRNTGSTMSVNNVFNISATINNDLDINTLARRLADLNETELRRRVSY